MKQMDINFNHAQYRSNFQSPTPPHHIKNYKGSKKLKTIKRALFETKRVGESTFILN